MKDYFNKNKINLVIVCIALIIILVLGIVILAIPLDKFTITDEVSLRVLDEQFYYEREDAYTFFASISESAMGRYRTFIILDFVLLGVAGVAMFAFMDTFTDKDISIAGVNISLLPSILNLVENILTLKAISSMPEYRGGLLRTLSIFTTLKWCAFIIWGLTAIIVIIKYVITKKKEEVLN